MIFIVIKATAKAFKFSKLFRAVSLKVNIPVNQELCEIPWLPLN